jgi:pimeloyl-ACP methyl ester carboxylesterase
MGFAFATTSYSANGLAVQEGIADIVDLVTVFGEQPNLAPPLAVFLVGASEGGLVTTLALERNPGVFAGGLATCGPIGSFTGQVNYWGDFRVLFDYFMDLPRYDVLPGSAVDIPEKLMTNWDSVYVPRVIASLVLRPLATRQLLAVSQAAYDPAVKKTIAESALGILWYNVFATNDAVAKLGGQPFDNHDRKYKGSYADFYLNRHVARFTADPAALAEIASNYETSGQPTAPLLTMHTSGDPIVPFWHETLYAQKAATSPLYLPPVEINRYGHCAFTLDEVQAGFGGLVSVVAPELLPPMPLTMQATEQPAAEEVYYYDYH